MNETNKVAEIIDGKALADQILSELKSKVEYYKSKYAVQATLAIILVGNNPASTIYVRNKVRAAAEVGILTALKIMPSDTSEQELLMEIENLNCNPDVSGIIIQLPLPPYIDKAKIAGSVNPQKDVDGFHPLNVGLLYSNNNKNRDSFVPCTAGGCLELIKSCNIDLNGKHAVIVGRSDIVGRPIAALLLKENCTVTICHAGTRNLADFTRVADIVIAATGKAKLLTAEYFNVNAIVIDVGISRIESSENPANKIIVGDVDFQEVKSKVSYITPVPGGVGPMTIASLLVNSFKAMLSLNKINRN